MRRKYVNNVFFASIFAEIRKKAVPLHVFCKTCVKTIKHTDYANKRFNSQTRTP